MPRIVPTNGKKFAKGVSGNPGGKPKKNIEVTELAKQECTSAFLRIVELGKCKKDLKVSLQANQYIVDRACGKPMQAVNLGGADGGPLKVVVNVMLKRQKADE